MANVTPNMPYHEMKEKILSAIQDYFKLELGRPEILNRIGDNIVVFDYIREDVAILILQQQLEKIAEGYEGTEKYFVKLKQRCRTVSD